MFERERTRSISISISREIEIEIEREREGPCVRGEAWPRAGPATRGVPAGSARPKTRHCDFVDFNLSDRILGASPCHPRARTRDVVLTQTCELLLIHAEKRHSGCPCRFCPSRNETLLLIHAGRKTLGVPLQDMRSTTKKHHLPSYSQRSEYKFPGKHPNSSVVSGFWKVARGYWHGSPNIEFRGQSEESQVSLIR